MAATSMPKKKTVGRYCRGEKIGYGNFGVVYKGVDTQTNRVVAIKTLDLDAINDEVESVQHEVELLSHLSMAESSNVTKYYGTVLEGSKLWIVMDLCSGGSVRTLLKAGPLGDKFLSVIFREIAIAVVAIHREGIIHRDIKAANVLITLSGQVKLCDFGVATNTNQSKRHTIVGTPYWMAPEVIAEGCSYTNKADIWSMGITFYEITTGNPPYSEHEAMRALMLITNSRPPRLEGPKYSPALKDLVAVCLDEDPDARPSAEEVLKHKFIKLYAKTPATALRQLVDRYISWKNTHSDHRDSLLMFNPHKDNDDAASIRSLAHGEDESDSVWDFSIDDTEDDELANTASAADHGTLSGTAFGGGGGGGLPPDDMSDAPDSLRELFGMPPRKEPSSTLGARVTDQSNISQISMSSAASVPQPSLSGGQQSATATMTSASALQQTAPPQLHLQHSSHQHSRSQFEMNPNVSLTSQTSQSSLASSATPASSMTSSQSQPTPQQLPQQQQSQTIQLNPPSLAQRSQSQPHVAQGFMFPPVKSHGQGVAAPSPLEKPQLQRVPTAISTPRSRSTTATVASGLRSQQYRSRNGSESFVSDTEVARALSSASISTPHSELAPQMPIAPLTSAPTTGTINTSIDTQSAQQQRSPSPSPTTKMNVSPTAASSPKRPQHQHQHQQPPQQLPQQQQPAPPQQAQPPQPLVGEQHVGNGRRQAVNLPRLQMPPRDISKPPMLMSAPAGPMKSQMLGVVPEQTSQQQHQVQMQLQLPHQPQSATIPNRSFSAASDISTMPPLLEQSVVEFPPMPKIETSILLDSTPDDLVTEHLFELASSFRMAVASLATQFDESQILY